MNPFEIIEKEGKSAIILDSAVAIILYTLDEQDVLDKIGVVVENNPHFPGGTYTSVVMGKVEKEDRSLLHRARAEVKEETGYDEIEHSRWDFLGEIYSSKILPESIYCYSVDVTGLTNQPPKGDGSEGEKGIKFVLLPISKIQTVPDSLLHSCFFKLFSKLYKNTFSNGTTKQKTEKAVG